MKRDGKSSREGKKMQDGRTRNNRKLRKNKKKPEKIEENIQEKKTENEDRKTVGKVP